jgi:phosphomannomutase/phosphoglucomutase
VIFDDGWGLVRASNTTPILVTRFEASSPEALERIRTLMNRLIEEAKEEG